MHFRQIKPLFNERLCKKLLTQTRAFTHQFEQQQSVWNQPEQSVKTASPLTSAPASNDNGIKTKSAPAGMQLLRLAQRRAHSTHIKHQRLVR
jgi:hypothetical protein